MRKERDGKKKGFLTLPNWRKRGIVSEGEADSGLPNLSYSSLEFFITLDVS